MIVTSLVNDIVMPLVGSVTGGIDFSSYFYPLSANITATNLEEARKQGAVFAYGNFITVVINFLILAFIIFLMVRAVNKMRRADARKPEEPSAPPQDILLLTEIRDLLARGPAGPV